MNTRNRQAEEGCSSRLSGAMDAGIDMMVLQAHARAQRAETIAGLAGRGLARLGRGLGSVWTWMERRRRDRALRRELSRLDPHTLRDLGLSPYQAQSATWEALSDHPLTLAASSAAAANENSDRENRNRAYASAA